MSKIQVNEIVNHFDTGAPDCPKGLTVTGFSTFTGGSSFSGDVSIGGTLTYEDVTNIDSVGIITAQSGVHYGTVGSGVTINAVGTGTSLGFLVNNSERARIDSSGRFGIGDAAPDALLSIKGNSDANTTPSIRLKDGSDTREAWITNASGDLLLNVGGDDNVPHGTLKLFESGILAFTQASGEKVRIDSSGRLLVGTSSESGNARQVVRGNTGSAAGAGVFDIGLGTTRPGSAGTPLGYLRFTSTSNTGSNYHYAAIHAETDGTSSSDTDIPGRLVFSTTADGASSPTERMRIDNQGRMGLGTQSPTQKLHIYDTNTAYLQLTTAGSTQTASGGFQLIHNGAGDLRANIVQRENAPMTFLTNDIERMRITNAGDITSLLGPYNNTIATGVNLHITSAGTLKRVASSAKYKTSIETLEDSYADNILNCRPVWYRALGDEENPEYSWYGFIAEEVAEIDPRLVQYREIEITYDEDGKPISTPLAEPEPEGVSYERFVPHLLNLIKRQKEQLELQGTAIAALETRLTALEGGAS